MYANPMWVSLEKYRDEKFRAEFLAQGKSVKDLEEEEERIYAEVTEEEDREMMTINQVMDRYNKDIISRPHLALQVRIVEHAYDMVNNNFKLLKVIQTPLDPGDEDEDDSDDEDYPAKDVVDVYSEFVKMHEKLQLLEFSDWEKDDKKYFRRLRAHFEAATIATADCVVCTASIMGSDVVRTNYAMKLRRTGKEFMCLLFEAAAMMNATEILMFTRFSTLENLREVIYCGDPKQFRGINPSAFAKPDVNEFIKHLNIFVFERLLLANFPSVRLTVNFRSHPDLIAFASDRNYDGQMRPFEGNEKALEAPELTTNVIKQLLKGENPRGRKDASPKSFNYCLIQIKQSKEHINPLTKSRSNESHARVVTKLIWRLLTSTTTLEIHQGMA